MANMVNIHIYPSSMKNESRILKEVQSIKKLNIFDEIILLGVYDKNLPKSWSIDETINVKLI
ncbi:MAG TPA: glycosyl transferase family 1, partial [Sulfurovum sp.]|nr:glycosyl transferase family 1 [Sulfurovum sp.]